MGVFDLEVWLSVDECLDSWRTVLFTSAFGLHQLTNPFVFQDKPNPEGRFSASLGHVYQLGRR
jgi:hypothetical protein